MQCKVPEFSLKRGSERGREGEGEKLGNVEALGIYVSCTRPWLQYLAEEEKGGRGRRSRKEREGVRGRGRKKRQERRGRRQKGEKGGGGKWEKGEGKKGKREGEGSEKGRGTEREGKEKKEKGEEMKEGGGSGRRKKGKFRGEEKEGVEEKGGEREREEGGGKRFGGEGKAGEKREGKEGRGNGRKEFKYQVILLHYHSINKYQTINANLSHPKSSTPMLLQSHGWNLELALKILAGWYLPSSSLYSNNLWDCLKLLCP